MSTRRTRGGVNLGLIRRTPSGRPRCRQCGDECPPRRRSFCSESCVMAWKLTRDPAYVREKVLERDDGICARCGMDTIAEFYRLKLLERTDPEVFIRECAERKITRSRKSLWDADHRIEVADGGGEVQLDGYQTLCIWCHREKSAANHSARSKRR